MRRHIALVHALIPTTLLALASACGGAETTQPVAPAPPVIVSLGATPASGVEPGGVMMVHYSVTSAEPLSRLRFYRSGAVTTSDSIGGRASLSVTDSVALPVPAGAFLGQAISLRMEVENTVRGVSSASLSSPIPVIDRTLPRIQARAVSWSGFNAGIDSLVLSADDTLTLKISANDNGTLAWVGYRITGIVQASDSLRPAGMTPDTVVFRIALKAGWAGTTAITTFARDAGGNEAIAAGRLTVIPVVQRPTTMLPLAMAFSRFAYDAKRSVIIASHFLNIAALELISLAPLAHAGTIALPGLAGSMDLTASGDSLLVAIPNTGSLAVVDLVARRVVGTIPITVPGLEGRPIHSVAVAASGKVLVSVFALAGAQNYYAVAEVDLATGAQRVRLDASNSAIIALGATRNRAEVLLHGGVSCQQLYVAATDQITACKQGSPVAGEISSNADGSAFLIGPSFVTSALSSVRVLTFPRFNSPVSQLSSDGATAYFATGQGGAGGGIALVRTSDGVAIQRIALPISTRVMLLLPDGSAVVTHGSVCTALSSTSTSCAGSQDVYVTSLR